MLGYSAAAAGLVLLALLRMARWLPQARPGPRSLHERPVPRVGGLAVWVGFAPVAVLAPPMMPGGALVWLVALTVVAVVSLIDDFRGVHPAVRLVGHLAAAVLLAQALVGTDAHGGSWVAFGGAAFVLVWGANLYNFMDGSDGLAAAMAVCGFAAYGIAAWQAGTPAIAYFALVAATLPFLALNLPPARIFIGDVGAVPLGFLAAAFGLGGWRTGTWPAWFPLLVFLPFIVDATLTLARRSLRGERVWEAHKMHYYQRLHQLGAGHAGTLLVYAMLIAATSISALAVLRNAPESGWVVLAAWSAALAVFFSGIDYFWRHRTPAHR